MRLLMVGSASCHKCKESKPKVESYCKLNGVEFNYLDTNSLITHADVVQLLESSGKTQLPLFIKYQKDKHPQVVAVFPEGANFYI